MGHYDIEGRFGFHGTSSEESMMKKLLQIMGDDEYDLPLDLMGGPFDLLGIWKEEYLPGKYSWNSLVPQLQLAPRLFAALFPRASFEYSISAWYSVTCEDTPSLTAKYENGRLFIREAELYNEFDAERIVSSLIESDEGARKYYEKLCEGGEEYSISLLSELAGELNLDETEMMESLYEFKEVEPLRDTEYEKSFFKGGDLQSFLVKEQIKNKDMTLAKYIQKFTFTKEQYQVFLQTAADCGFVELTAFLLEEIERRYAVDKKDDVSRIIGLV